MVITVDQERRARLHAALGEPVRLAIVDRLAVGDASPGELGASLSLASNLLAHHLGVLDDAGVIRRVRSEGDRRRSYVQLRLDDSAVTDLVRPGVAAAPDQLSSDPARVVFICTHNSARSQLAAAAWRRVNRVTPATSAGTHPAARVHARAIEVGRRHGLRLGNARTSRLDAVHVPGDLLVAVCDNAHEELPAGADLPRLHWSVPDPVRVDTEDAFETACADLTRRVERLSAAVCVP